MTSPEAIIETRRQIFPHTPETGLVAELVMTAEALNVLAEDPPYREPGSIYRRYENERVFLTFPGNGLTDSEREFLALTRTFTSLARRRAITDRWPKTKVKTERNYESSPLVPELELAIHAWKSIPKRMSDKACDKIGDVSPSLPKMKRSGQQATKPSDAVAAMLHDALQVVDGEIKLSDTTRAAELVNTTIGYIVDEALDPAIDLHKAEEMLHFALGILGEPKSGSDSDLISQRALAGTPLATTIKDLYKATTLKDAKYLGKELREPLEAYLLKIVMKGMGAIDPNTGATMSEVIPKELGAYQHVIDHETNIAVGAATKDGRKSSKQTNSTPGLVEATREAISQKYLLTGFQKYRSKSQADRQPLADQAKILLKVCVDIVGGTNGEAGAMAERIFQAMRTPLAMRPLLASTDHKDHAALDKRYKDLDRLWKKYTDPKDRAIALLDLMFSLNSVGFRLAIDGSRSEFADILTDETRGVAELQLGRSDAMYAAMTGMPPHSDSGWTKNYDPLHWLTTTEKTNDEDKKENPLITWFMHKLKFSPIRLLNEDRHLSKTGAPDNLALFARVSHLEDQKALATLRKSITDMYETVIDTAGKAKNAQERDSLTYLLMCGLADITLGKDVSQEGWTPDTVLYDKLTGLLVPMLVGRLKGDEAVKKSTLQMIAHVSPYWRLETKKALLDAVVDETLARSSDLLAKSTFKDLCYALALTSPETHPHWVVELGNPEVDPKLYDVAIAPAIAKLIAGYETRKASTLGHDDSLLAELAKMGKILGNNQEGKPNADKVAAAKAVCIVPVILDVAGATAPTGEVKEARFHGIKVRVRKELLESLRIRIDTAIAPLQHEYKIATASLEQAKSEVREKYSKLLQALGGTESPETARANVATLVSVFKKNLKQTVGMEIDLKPQLEPGQGNPTLTTAPELDTVINKIKELTMTAGEAMPEGSAAATSFWMNASAGSNTQNPMQTASQTLLSLLGNDTIAAYIGVDTPAAIGAKRIAEIIRKQTGVEPGLQATQAERIVYALTEILPQTDGAISWGQVKAASLATGEYIAALNTEAYWTTKCTTARLALRSARLGHFLGSPDDSSETQEVIKLVEDANVALTHLDMPTISFADALEEANETAAQESAQPLLTSGAIPIREEQIPAPQAPKAVSSKAIKLKPTVVRLIQQTLAPLGTNYSRREEIETALKALIPKLTTLDEGAAAELIQRTVEAITNPK